MEQLSPHIPSLLLTHLEKQNQESHGGAHPEPQNLERGEK